MGSSAGGHLAAVIARRARDDAQLRSSPITGQILQVPVTCHPDAYSDRSVHETGCVLITYASTHRYRDQLLSFDSIVDAPKLSNKTMRWAWGSSALPRSMIVSLTSITDRFQCDPHHPDASPLLGSFEGLPPIFVQVAGMDPLRDEGLLYEKLAQEAGIETKLCMCVFTTSIADSN